MNLLIASLPIFIIIIAGYLVALFNFFDKEASVVLIRLIFYIIMPITLFLDIAQLPISNTLRWDYMGAYFFTSIIVMLISIIMSRYLFARDRSNLIINAMASTHTNTAYLALPLFLLLFKTVSPVASIIIVQAVFNFFILLGMDVTTGAKQNKSYSYTIFAVFWKNPILIGIILGVIFSSLHIELPHIISSTFTIVSKSALFIALFALGLSLRVDKASLNKKQKLEISMLIVLKSFVHPLIAFLVGYYIFGLTGFMLTALILMAAMPVAKNLFVFAKRYQVGVERANIIVFITTVISILTLNLILLLRH